MKRVKVEVPREDKYEIKDKLVLQEGKVYIPRNKAGYIYCTSYCYGNH